MQPLDPLTLSCQGTRLIEASAGTGKTWTIATLYLRLLLEERRSLRELLVVTFTQAATEELRDRIRARIREAVLALRGAGGGDPILQRLLERVDDRAELARRLEEELTGIDEAAIFTIHGFCQRILQENAFESGAWFDAEFITNEAELLSAVVEDFWRREFYPDAGLARLAAEQWKTPTGLLGAIRPYVGKTALRILPEPDSLQCGGDDYRKALAEVRTLWEGQREAILQIIAENKDLGRAEKTYRADKVDEAAEALSDFLADAANDFTLPQGFVLFTTAKLADSISRAKRAKGAEPPVHPFFDACQTLSELCDKKRLDLLVRAISFARDELARRKQQMGVLSFDDLLTGLSAALRGEGGAELASRIAARYPVALIDEFQDTDPTQYSIFATIYRDRPDTALFMIGDPKQAIYSFRGADVFTYMQAKSATDEQSERFTLGVNWRSANRLVEGVNALFSACTAPFIHAGQIDFHPVSAAGQTDQAPLLLDDQSPVPLQAWFVARDESNVDGRGKGDPQSKGITKTWAREQLSAACAEEVVRLLQLGLEGRATLGGEPLRQRDIAVLVRSRHEAEAVRDALAERGVASVYHSRDSVFDSEEAGELLRLLVAVAEPGDERALRAALCGRIVGTSAAELDALLHDEIAWERRVEAMHEYYRLWLDHGFMAMFRRLLHDLGVPRRLLQAQDGERRLTNLLQLGELVQTASADHHGIEHLLRWLREQCAAPNGESEDQQLRLESDAELVRIVTIHKSKGLEYPIVFLPFLWGCRPVEPKKTLPLFHDPVGDGLVLDLERSAEHYALMDRERLAEDLRLVYVALTRAKHLCYFAWGGFNDAGRSALAWLLHSGDGAGDPVVSPEEVAASFPMLDDEALRERLEAVARKAPASLQVCMPPAPRRERYRPPAETPPPLVAMRPQRRVVQDWQVTSYTGLALGRFDGARPDYGSAREDRNSEEDWGESSPSRPAIFRFPRGARTGTFLHQLFERLDFARLNDETLAHEVAQQLGRHGFDLGWQPLIETLVRDVLDTPLDDLGTLRLRSIGTENRLAELEFHYPLAGLAARDLNALLPGLEGLREETPQLEFNPVAGVMRGFIDLVFEHQGRYFLLDYKSNHLGERLEDYCPEALDRVVAHYRYDLQYLIYTVALHRYLRHRVPGYAYGTHFGGVYYLFLRGMRPDNGPATGVYFTQPEQTLVEALDRLFAGEGELV